MMDPGQLNKKIIIQHNINLNQRDELGGKLPPAWQPYLTCWANKRTERARLDDYMNDHVEYQSVIFIIRKPSKVVSTSMQVFYAGQTYDITSITDYDGAPAYLALNTTLIQPGG